eukprot:Sspe_Gene.5921::Locus_1981_Transcript_1_1_Confidence_1.000_Length_1432::g.5921::m.5921/K03514/PAPD5_7, TRF4; non-canonical poly(A) RNA polymerase PAPD5/7
MPANMIDMMPPSPMPPSSPGTPCSMPPLSNDPMHQRQYSGHGYEPMQGQYSGGYSGGYSAGSNGGYPANAASMPSLLPSSSSEAEGSVPIRKIDRSRRRTATGQTIVTTPWYPQGIVKDTIQLSGEVEALCRLLQLTEEEKTKRNICRSSLQEVVRQFWPSVTVKVYGSFAYGLSLPNSALDLVCEGCGELTNFPKFLETLGRMQFTVEGSFSAGAEGFARVKSSCGVVANVSFVPGRSLARQSVATIRKLLAQYPLAPTVFATVRLVLQQSRCNDAREGGLASYALLVMTLHACNKTQPQDAGQLLAAFFRIFGCGGETVVSVNAKPTAKGSGPGTLWVEDPLDPTNNIAAGCKRLPQIRSVFQTSAMTLEKWLTSRWAGYRGRTPLSSILAYGDLWDRAASMEDEPPQPVNPSSDPSTSSS